MFPQGLSSPAKNSRILPYSLSKNLLQKAPGLLPWPEGEDLGLYQPGPCAVPALQPEAGGPFPRAFAGKNTEPSQPGPLLCRGEGQQVFFHQPRALIGQHIPWAAVLGVQHQETGRPFRRAYLEHIIRHPEGAAVPCAVQPRAPGLWVFPDFWLIVQGRGPALRKAKDKQVIALCVGVEPFFPVLQALGLKQGPQPGQLLQQPD